MKHKATHVARLGASELPITKGKRSYHEDALQKAVAELLDTLGWWWWHTPNGGARSKAEAGKFKAMGVKAGVADIIIAERWSAGNDGGPAVAIELKGPKGRLQKTQKEWLAEAQHRKWLVAVCRTVDEVLDVIHFVQPMNGRKPKRQGKEPDDPRQIDWTKGGKR